MCEPRTVREVVDGRVPQARRHAPTSRARERELSLNATLCELLERGLAESAQPPLEKRIRATRRPAGPGRNEIKPCRRMRERRRVRAIYTAATVDDAAEALEL